MKELDRFEVIAALAVLWRFQPLDQKRLHRDNQHFETVLRCYGGIQYSRFRWREYTKPGEAVPPTVQAVNGVLTKTNAKCLVGCSADVHYLAAVVKQIDAALTAEVNGIAAGLLLAQYMRSR